MGGKKIRLTNQRVFQLHIKTKCYQIDIITDSELSKYSCYIKEAVKILSDIYEKTENDLVKTIITCPIYNLFSKIITVNSAPNVSSHFIGREEKLKEIKKSIEEGKSVILVSGMGGIGKTEICKKLFHEYRKMDGKIKYIGWIVWNNNLKDSFHGKFYETMKIDEVDKNFIRAFFYLKCL